MRRRLRLACIAGSLALSVVIAGGASAKPLSGERLVVDAGFSIPAPELGGTWSSGFALFAPASTGIPDGSALGSSSLTVPWRCAGGATPDPGDDVVVTADFVSRWQEIDVTGRISRNLAWADLEGTLRGQFAVMTPPTDCETPPPSGTLEVTFQLDVHASGPVRQQVGGAVRDATGFIVVDGVRSPIRVTIQRFG